jgi:hypothetical protein
MASATIPALETGCNVCGATVNLSRCTRCNVVKYCSRDPQAAEFDFHKAACKSLAKCRLAVEKEARELRNKPADMFLPEDVFNTSVGHF